MRNYIGTELDRTAVYGSGEGIIDNERYTVFVSDLRKSLYIKHRQRGICDSLTEYSLGIRTECRAKLILGSIGVRLPSSKEYS